MIEAETGAHLWADKFDGALDDVFDLQDQITERVVGVVEPSVQKSEIERSRRKPPENLDAYDLYLRALPHLTFPMAADAKIAAAFLREALRLEPTMRRPRPTSRHCHEICFFRGGFDPADRAPGHAQAVLATDGRRERARHGRLRDLAAGTGLRPLAAAASEKALSRTIRAA